MLQFGDMRNIPERNAGYHLKRVEVCKIGNPRKTDHRQIQKLYFLIPGKAFRQTVFIFHLNVQIRGNANYVDARPFFQHFHTGIENRLVPAELIDDHSFDHRPFLRIQQFNGSNKLGKHTAPVDIPHQKDRRMHQFCQTHIYDIVCLQVDLRRRACAFDHDDIIL